jgi:holo-[acyl-carrier protein] synthase
MAILGIGIDVVEVSRMDRALADPVTGERFRIRVFTEGEREYCRQRAGRAESFAGRFAAKEAVMKALGSGAPWGFAWQDIEVVREPSGFPSVVLRGRALKRARAMGAGCIHLSISHAAGIAVAEAVAERES